MSKLSGLDWVALILTTVGGLNWGLVGFLNWNLVMSVFGSGSVSKVIYMLVGLSALWMLIKLSKFTK